MKRLLIVPLLFLSLCASATISCTSGLQLEGYGPSAGLNASGASLLLATSVGYEYPAFLADSKANIWQYGSEYGGVGAASQSQISWVPAPTTSGSQTFSVEAVTGLFPSAIIFSCTGTTFLYPMAAQNGLLHTTSASFQTGSVTPLEAGDLVVAMSGCDNPGTITSVTIDSGFSAPVVNTSASYETLAASYLVVASTAALNPTFTWTISNSANCSAAISVFRPSSVTPPALAGPQIRNVAGKGGAQGYAGDGAEATLASLYWPGEIAFDSHGNYCFADIDNNVIRCVNKQLTTQTLYGVSICSGCIETVAGNNTLGCVDNATATSGELAHPVGLAIDSSNSLYVADQQCNAVRKITTAGAMSTAVGTLAQHNCSSGSFSGDGGPATSAVLFCPQGVAVDSSGNIIVSDTNNYRLRVTNTQGTTQNLYGQTGICSGCIQTFYGNGVDTTVYPLGLGFDPSGHLYIADYFNFRVLEITATGIESVFAGTGTQGYGPAGGSPTSAALNHVYDVKVDAVTGAVYIADTFNSTIWQVSSGTISVLAGNHSLVGTGGGYIGVTGPASLAALSGTVGQGVGPVGVAPDGQGNIYEADTGNNRIREITPQGCIGTCMIGGSKWNGGVTIR